MFLFVDGQPVVLTFNQVEQRYYAAFVTEFPEAEVSLSQWRGGYEYQTLYPAMQQMVENGAMTLEALNEVLGTIAAINESIRRPAVLASRVTERFKEFGYEATVRAPDLSTKGIVAICVEQKGGDDAFIGELIRDEMLPVGQFMDGDVVFETAFSNGQPVDIKWTLPTPSPLMFKLTIDRKRGSPHPEDTVDQIITKFNANYAAQMGIGIDVTPATYMTTVDLKWAASVLVQHSTDGATWTDAVIAAAYNVRYDATLDPANVVIA